MAKKIETAPEAEQQQVTDEKKITIGSIVTEMVMDAALTYDNIVDMVREQFPEANTSRRSVASVASRLRKAGIDVPKRKAAKAE